MQRAERLAVIGGLAAGVAHEIRNPLASISGSIELLTAAPQVDDDSRALAEIVHREVARPNTLISELLDYANPRPLAAVDLDVSELVRETLRVFQQDRDFARVALEAELPEGGGPVILADPEKLRQVLWNLLRNAAEATDEGKVTVRVELQPAGKVGIAVIDNGPGISSEHLERIFDPFFTTKQAGSGLGLATVHAIVIGHGGTVHVSSKIGQGATFVVRLPYPGGKRAEA
jgi:signal transduction histidine kinase